jgi:uncharacterized SAM-binding protein YcdF (DUF218 family)
VARRSGFKALLSIVLLAAAAAAARLCLPWLGYALVRDDGPAKADLAVVLAGDSYGHRIETAACLVKDGYVPAVLVSGPLYYGVPECDLAIALMVRKGYPENWFLRLPNEARSTSQEALEVLEELRRRGVRSFLLVTSSYHTARAARAYRAAGRSRGGGPRFRVVAAPDEFFRPREWWGSRDGQKIVVIEWLKTAAYRFGM